MVASARLFGENRLPLPLSACIPGNINNVCDAVQSHFFVSMGLEESLCDALRRASKF